MPFKLAQDVAMVTSFIVLLPLTYTAECFLFFSVLNTFSKQCLSLLSLASIQKCAQRRIMFGLLSIAALNK